MKNFMFDLFLLFVDKSTVNGSKYGHRLLG